MGRMVRCHLLSILAFLACQRPPSSQKVVARDLTRELSPTEEETDTAAQRADSQFQTCLYVYDSEEKLRECLVLKQGWTAENAARRIALYQAQVRKTADSLLAELRREQHEETARIAAARVAERRRRDSVYKATHREWLDGPPVDIGPGALPWMMDTRTKAYYRSECEAASRIPLAARQYFGYQEDARAKGWPSREPECQ
jgi:hypothetical protein